MRWSSLTPELEVMADFRPFPAWRYNLEKVPIQEVIAPPYDVISPEERKKLYAQSPYNCIRLILNLEEDSDNEANNRYTRARDFFCAWQRSGILIQDREDTFYLYRQTFMEPVRKEPRERFALLGRMKLEPFEKGIVVPHEKTMTKPREDRRKLLEATGTNFSPVFGLYEDSQGEVSSVYSEILSTAPLFDIRDEEGVSHALWVVHERQFLERIHEGLVQKEIYIADGHHRYQTALEYARDKRLREGLPPHKVMPFDYVLTALVEFHDPGLVLLPMHRILQTFPWNKDLSRGDVNSAKALDSLKDFFKIESYSPEALKRKIQEASREEIVFGLVLEKEQFLLNLRDWNQAKEIMPPGRPDIWYRLDVHILSYLIFDLLWKFPESQWESLVQYTQSMEEAVRRVRNGQADAAFLLKAPHVETLRAMGEARELMPQKTTYFYPKLASGLVFYHHSEGGNHGN